MTWEILAALITIVGCLVTLGSVLVKLIRTLTMLDVTLKDMQKEIGEMKTRSEKSHGHIHDRLDEHGAKLEDHELRIHDLEHAQHK